MNNGNERGRFSSSPTGFQPRNQFQSTPKLHPNRFQRSGPYPRSPVYNNQSNMHIPRNSSPYRHVYSPNSFNSNTSSPEQWNLHPNQSYHSNSSSSYFGDVSQQSSYISPNRISGGSYYPHNRNKRFQENYSWNNKQSKSNKWSPKINSFTIHKSSLSESYYQVSRRDINIRVSKGNRSFQSPDSKNSNPGHSNDIRHYVHSSMLEDPWKDLMAEIEKNTTE